MYFGEPKHSISRRPDPEKEQLAEQNALLRKLLKQQMQSAETTTRKHRKWSGARRMSPVAVFGVTLVVIAGGVFAYYTLAAPEKHHIAGANAFPVSTIQQIKGFRFYYFKPGFQTDYALRPDTIHYQDGVLVFGMKSSNGKVLAFTEEPAPQNFDISALQTTRRFNTEYGQATVADESGRTTGALFSQDGTWVLVNTPQSIGADLMQRLIEALAPASQ